MEVTVENFKGLLPQIERTINDATFLAIDCEFSGLDVGKEINAFDTPKQYYEKVRKNCRDFIVLQYGISAFRFDATEAVFKQQSYNFYIFRRPINRNIADQRFLCQTSSIHFLTTQGFDFNKLFKSGIPYLNLAEETDYREKIDEKLKNKTNQLQTPKNSGQNDLIPVPDNMQAFYNEIMKKIEEFHSGDLEELDLPKCNAFMRRLIYQTVQRKYKDKLSLQTKNVSDKDRILNVSKFKSRNALENQLKQDHEDELALLDDSIGFTKVLRLIVNSGKLVVGHNMCLDFLHTIDKFLTPLSSNYDEFKECAHSLFKNVLDTKFMSSSEQFSELIQSTVLKDLLGTVSTAPFKMPTNEIEENGQGYSLNEMKDHEAGFDAYMTGLAFISMWNHLGKGKQVDFSNFSLIEPYCNKIFLMMLRDNQYIHLGGSDPNPARGHVFFLTFPKEWSLNNIVELFSPFGGVYVAWVSECSAYVGLYKKEQASVALSTLSQSDTYSITTYAKRQTNLSSIEDSRKTTPNRQRKRGFELMTPKLQSKKLKTDFQTADSGSKGSKERLEPESEKSKGEPKTFVESDAWD